jgi:hypothetical protein
VTKNDQAMQVGLDHIAHGQAEGKSLRQIMATVGHPSEASEGLTACAFLLAGIWLRLDLCLEARGLNLPDDTSGHQSAN